MPSELDQIYRPPATPASKPPRRPPGKLHGYTPLRTLTRVVAVCIAVCAAQSVLTLSTNAYVIVHLEETLAQRGAPFSVISTLNNYAPSVALLSFVVAGVTFLTWVYRVHGNIPALGRRSVVTPTGAVLHYFFPFLNLVRPWQHMMVAWRLSSPKKSLRDAPSTIGWWWATWMARGVVFGLIAYLAEPAVAASSWDRLERIRFAAGSKIVLDLMNILAAGFCVQMLFALNARQEQAAQRRHARIHRKRDDSSR